MSKGTPSMGKKSGKKTHIVCRRCGHRTYHPQKKRCSDCGYGDGGSAKLRSYSWQKK